MTDKQGNGSALFKPGEHRVGRAKGTPNRTTREIKDAVMEAFRGAHPKGPAAYLTELARQRPELFVPLLARILPTELKFDPGEERRLTYRNFAGSASRYAPQKPLEPDVIDADELA